MFSVGDKVVYPYHGAGKVTAVERKEMLGRQQDYLTIQIFHSRMTVMVPVEGAERVGLRKVAETDILDEVFEVLRGDANEMPDSWSHRHKYNHDKLKTGDIFEVAEVVRNLAIRDADRGLSMGDTQMLTKAKVTLASELMYARNLSEDEATGLVEDALARVHVDRPAPVDDIRRLEPVT